MERELIFRRFVVAGVESKEFVENPGLITLFPEHPVLCNVFVHRMSHRMLWGGGLRFTFYDYKMVKLLQGQEKRTGLSIET